MSEFITGKYTEDDVEQIHGAWWGRSAPYLDTNETKAALHRLHEAGITVTTPESRFYVLAPFGGPKATVFERGSGPKADFFGKNAAAYAEEHADRLNREAQS